MALVKVKITGNACFGFIEFSRNVQSVGDSSTKLISLGSITLYDIGTKTKVLQGL